AIVFAHVPGGASEILAAAHVAGTPGSPLAHLFDPVPTAPPAGAGFFEQITHFFTIPMPVAGIFIATLVGRMTVYTPDQVMVQRFQTTRSVKDATQAFIINAVGDAMWMFGLAFVGLALFAYFQHHPLAGKPKADEIFPHFMAEHFPTGMVGLVIAAIFAASLGGMGGAINSCTSVVVGGVSTHLGR